MFTVMKQATTLTYTGFILIFISLGTGLNAQSAVTGQLSFNDVLRLVKAYHPLMQQARLQPEFAAAEWLKAKGGFDPSLSGNVSQKYYDGKDYYSLFSGELKIPTAIGADVKTGFEQNRGSFLGPENATPTGGLYYAGISMPLGQGLIIDKRRAALRSADIMKGFASARQKEMANEILYDAGMKYWDWFRAFHIRQIYLSSLQNARERFNAIKTNVTIGERPAIDTTEAKIQIQNILLGLNLAELDYKNTSILFSGLFWDESGTPAGLPDNLIPIEAKAELENNTTAVLPIDKSDFAAIHPYLEQLRQKTAQLEVDKNLKKDKLKPKINLQYNPLTESVGGNIFANYNINNYKWGMEFKMPLFLRKERGDIRLADLKIKETDMLLRHKTTELYNKYNTYISEWKATQEQISIYTETVKMYEQMYNAEKRQFNIGESSLFLVNAREQAYINAKIKLTELIAKNRLAFYTIYFYAGQLEDVIE